MLVWYLSWGGLLLLTILNEWYEVATSQNKIVPQQTVKISKLTFSIVAGVAALFHFPLPWAAVVGLLVYGLLHENLTVHVPFVDLGRLFRDPVPALCAAFALACALQLTLLEETAAMPVWLGAIALWGTNSRGVNTYLNQLWMPIAITFAFVPHGRVYWLLAILLAIVAVYVIVGCQLTLPGAWNTMLFLACKALVFVVILAVFQPFDATPQSDGSLAPAEPPPCTIKFGMDFATDYQNVSCFAGDATGPGGGPRCPLSFNANINATLVCGGIDRGECVPLLDGAHAVCACYGHACGRADEMRFFPEYDRYFYLGCSDAATACRNGTPPNDNPLDPVTVRALRPEYRCACICDSPRFVGPACNASCVGTTDGDFCRGSPCVYNATTGKAQCDCEQGRSGVTCNNYDCNGHGHITAGGTCVCDEGFYPAGSNATDGVCNSTCTHTNCNGHGQCASKDTCACVRGWLPPLCTSCNPNTTDACGAYGKCVNNACKCNNANLNPLRDCAECTDPNREYPECSKCAVGFYRVAENDNCKPCDSQCPHGCTGGPQACDCTLNLVGPKCTCNRDTCEATGGKCNAITGACMCTAKCVDNETPGFRCGDDCKNTLPCGQRGVVDPQCCTVDGRCSCAFAGGGSSCRATPALNFGH